MVLPLVGLLLLMPPLATVFELDLRIAGVPFTLAYLFGVWGLMILACAALSRALQYPDDDTHDDPTQDVDRGPPTDPGDHAA
jgi:hypothetical protein